MTVCPTCQEPVQWARTESTSTRLALDPLPRLDGRWVIISRDERDLPIVRFVGIADTALPRYGGHLATCTARAAG